MNNFLLFYCGCSHKKEKGMTCRYRNALGRPREGIHHLRFAGMAANDIIMTLIAAFVFVFLAFRREWGHATFWKLFVVMIVFLWSGAILLHRFFCVRTTLDMLLFPKI
jgi:hypothetical protein